MLGCSSMFYCQGLTHCHWLSFFLPENEKKTKQNNSKVKRKISGSVKIAPYLEKNVCFGWLWMLNISKLEGKDAIVSLTSVRYKTSQELWVLSSVTFFVRSLWLKWRVWNILVFTKCQKLLWLQCLRQFNDILSKSWEFFKNCLKTNSNLLIIVKKMSKIAKFVSKCHVICFFQCLQYFKTKVDN